MKHIRVRKDSIIAQVRKVHLFRYLSTEAVQRVLDCSTYVEYETGEYFIHEHEIESTVYIILAGTCAVMVDHGDREHYVAALGPGQVVGEAALFANFARTASVMAQSTSRLMCFERKQFLQVLRDEPEAGLRILYVLVHNLMGKLREVNLELAFERRDHSDQEEVDALIESLINGD